jgi:hypothetical protein
MEDKPAPPIACDLHKLTSVKREREKNLLNEVRKAALEIRDLHLGYALRFPGDAGTVLTLAEFITLERACCPFLDFELRCEAEGGPVSLSVTVTGREGVKQFLEQLLIQ